MISLKTADKIIVLATDVIDESDWQKLVDFVYELVEPVEDERVDIAIFMKYQIVESIINLLIKDEENK